MNYVAQEGIVVREKGLVRRRIENFIFFTLGAAAGGIIGAAIALDRNDRERDIANYLMANPALFERYDSDKNNILSSREIYNYINDHR